MLIGWDYSGPARALVLALKLRAQRTCARPLAEALATRVHRRGLRATALTWVPGRRGDIRRRGFDHAAEIARHLSRSLGLPAFPLLERRQERPDQTELSKEERRLNLEGAFRARASPIRIALVDDLITTGATATACALALKAAGAGSVDLLAACSRENWGKSDA
jgi:ComF family protein